jgi:hypothetical protein
MSDIELFRAIENRCGRMRTSECLSLSVRGHSFRGTSLLTSSGVCRLHPQLAQAIVGTTVSAETARNPVQAALRAIMRMQYNWHTASRRASCFC